MRGCRGYLNKGEPCMGQAHCSHTTNPQIMHGRVEDALAVRPHDAQGG